ncbi:MAG: NUDIX domain-containing protein [Acidimicrobiia bacterium]
MSYEFEKLRSSLENYQVHDEKERISYSQIIDFLRSASTDDVFDRDSHNWHITASAVVLFNNNLLLHFHKKIKSWIQPGGHVDRGESPLQAATRECLEETGIKTDLSDQIFHIDVHDVPNGHRHFDVRYLGHTDNPYFDIGDDESKRVAWFNIDCLDFIKDVSLKGAIDKLRKLEY